jgi:hypothetical protein
VRTLVTVQVSYPTPAPDVHIDDEFALGVVAMDGDARVQARTERALSWAGGRFSGEVTVTLWDVIDLPARALTARVGVASARLGRAGTVQMPIDIAELNGDRLELGGVLIGVAGRVTTMIGPADVATALPFTPTVGRVFAPGETVRVFVPMAWRGDKPATVTVGVAGSDMSQPRAHVLNGTTLNGDRRRAVLDATLPLTNLAAGDYTLEIQAAVPDVAQTVAKRVPFSVR